MINTPVRAFLSKTKLLADSAVAASKGVAAHGTAAAFTCVFVPSCVGYSLGSGHWLGYRYLQPPVEQLARACSSAAELETLPPMRARPTEGQGSPRSVTVALSRAQGSDELLAVVRDRGPTFTGTNISAALFKMASLGVSRQSPEGARAVKDMEDGLRRCAGTLDGRSLANSARALVRLGSPCPDLMRALMERAIEVSDSLDPRDVPVLLNACLKATQVEPSLRGPAQELFRSLSPAAARLARSFSPRDLCQTASAYARFGLGGDAAMAELADAIAERAGSFSPQDVSMAACAFARAAPRPALFEALGRRAAETAGGFGARDVSGAAWALARAGAAPEGAFEALEARASAADVWARMGPIDVARTAWAFASAGRMTDRLLEALSRRAEELGPQAFGGRELAAVACAVAESPAGRKAAARRLVSLLEPALERSAPAMTPHEVVSAWRALVRLRIRRGPLPAALSARASELAGQMRPSDAARVAWAALVLRLKEPLLEPLRGAALRHADRLKPQDLTAVMSAAAANLPPSSSPDARDGTLQLVHALASQAHRRAAELSHKELAAALWVCTTVGVLHPGLFEAAEARLAAAAESSALPPALACKVLWAYLGAGLGSGALLRAVSSRLAADPEAFSPSELSIVLRAQDAAGAAFPGALEAARVSVLLRGLSAFSPAQAAAILLAFARLGHPAPSLFSAADRFISARTGEWHPFWLRRTLKAFAVAQHPAPLLITAVEARVRRHVREGSLSEAEAERRYGALLGELWRLSPQRRPTPEDVPGSGGGIAGRAEPPGHEPYGRSLRRHLHHLPGLSSPWTPLAEGQAEMVRCAA